MRNLIITVIVVFFLGLLTVGLVSVRFWLGVPGQAQQERIFEVAPGSSFKAIAERLEAEGLVESAFKLRILGRLTGYDSRAKVGEYSLNMGMRPMEILQVIASGRSLGYPLTVTEGMNILDIAIELESRGFGSRQEFLNLVRDQDFVERLLGERLYSLEGYLFPETYMVTRYMGMKDIVEVMVARFIRVWESMQDEALAKGMSRHEVVIFASLIEKETGAPWERPIISSVFHNRLNKNMRLQSDPTILYGMFDETDEMPRRIRRVDIRRPNRFNTYTVNGLPFGPVANPGRESLLAVLRPQETDYLFFVSQNDGTHIFSRTYDEHRRAVQRYQVDPKAREGRSWRELSERLQRESLGEEEGEEGDN